MEHRGLNGVMPVAARVKELCIYSTKGRKVHQEGGCRAVTQVLSVCWFWDGTLSLLHQFLHLPGCRPSEEGTMGSVSKDDNSGGKSEIGFQAAILGAKLVREGIVEAAQI